MCPFSQMCKALGFECYCQVFDSCVMHIIFMFCEKYYHDETLDALCAASQKRVLCIVYLHCLIVLNQDVSLESLF
jgi:hypothetical protein